MSNDKPLKSEMGRNVIQKEDLAGRIRRLSDVAISVILLAITLPLLLIIGLAIKLEGPGPVLERRECVGRRGRRFRRLKFRATIYGPEHAYPGLGRADDAGQSVSP